MKYSIDEIIEMRGIIIVCETGIFSDGRQQNEQDAMAEKRLETYMRNGTTLEELKEQHKEKLNKIH